MKPFLSTLFCSSLVFVGFTLSAFSQEAEIKVGIIGLDTGHVIAFTKTMNDPAAKGALANCKVVAAYPKGSPDIESSVSRVPKYTEEIQAYGVEIVDSIPALLEKVDAVLLETNDGRPHLEQVVPVLKAGKRVFIDKPIAGSLTDAILIFEASKKYDVPLFSSSSLRYGPKSQQVRSGSIGTVTNAKTGSPASLEKTHPDLFWYGIHGVESLFTVMGTGCESVVRSTTEEGMIQVTGTWKGNRTGIFEERKGYGGTATGSKGESEVGAYPGYAPLVVEIAKYFVSGTIPVDPAETLEIYAFMEAADESKRNSGASVTLDSVFKKAQKAAQSRLGELE
ncbi:Gfo/Idh/MocA family oxidoreductase [Verrucomicrobiales bacterium]|nr:Gfo/Idh/MocA family oxidoreductase [Verrucomicrobiales bacterium]MDC0292154.1 Gfo/Idh/MocA family oxidoreductase [Verrucomicrobiales bacterium]